MKLECPFPKLYGSELVRDDSYFMKCAYNEAIKAWEEDEVPIGCIIVHNGIIIAAAHNSVVRLKDPTAHAEMLAITQAAKAIGDWRLNACTLYVTKEPCPMCSGAMIMSRMGRVVYAFGDPKMGGLGGCYNCAEMPSFNHSPVVESGILKEECQTLLQSFFLQKRNQKALTE